MIIPRNNIDLKSTLLSGQCFRIKENDDGSFTCILDDRIINIKEDNNSLIVTSNNETNLKEKIINYLDLDTDYSKYINYLSSKDTYLSKISHDCEGYHILRQNKFEMFISYIISQNNNVKRISSSIDKISMKCGQKIEWNNNVYYLFPTLEELSTLSLEDLRNTGVGFRDKYIFEAVNFLKNNPSYIDELEKMGTLDALTSLCTLKGIGLKVASCILLFGYYKLDVFPIDTWVIKNITNNYKDVKPNQKSIKDFCENKFGNLCGLAIQYMFHYERNKKSNL